MKLAEALALRADLQRRLERLKQRLTKNAGVQEGEQQPPENPEELLTEFEQSASELTQLAQRISRTNGRSHLNKAALADALDRTCGMRAGSRQRRRASTTPRRGKADRSCDDSANRFDFDVLETLPHYRFWVVTGAVQRGSTE